MEFRDRLAHVRWIGGGPGAGKTSVAQMLAIKHGAAIYDGDAGERDYVARCSIEDQPKMMAWIATPLEERWKRPPKEIFRSMASLHGETFGFVVDDLLKLPTDRPIIVDDFRTLPNEVAPILTRRDDAVFVIPTPEFRRMLLERRYADPVRAQTSLGLDVGVAMKNRLGRDALWDAEVRRQAQITKLPIITIDGMRSVEDLAEDLAVQFRLGRSSSS